MSYLNSDILLLSNPIGIDAIIQSYQRDFYANLSWLTKSFGRAWDMREGSVKVPKAYMGLGEYHSVLPNDALNAQSFICARSEEKWPDYPINGLERNLSFVFWVNLKAINPDKDYIYTEELRWDVEQLIKKNPYTKTINAYFDDRVEDIFLGYIGKEFIGTQYLMYPYSGFRYDITVAYPEHSCSAPWTTFTNYLTPSYAVMTDRHYTIGTTSGAPIAGQTTFQHNDFINRKIRLVRSGLKQGIDGSDQNWFWSFVGSTGIITVNPAWIDTEQISVEIYA